MAIAPMGQSTSHYRYDVSGLEFVDATTEEFSRTASTPRRLTTGQRHAKGSLTIICYNFVKEAESAT